MHTSAPFSEERAELDAVLRSGIFARSPSLAQFLQYVCERYFEGEADKIKEYNVAVEALGRPQEFDQKKDSIVRVEAHRLRKRLHEYYREQGAEHAIRITIPPGNYVPQFVRKSNNEQADAVETSETRDVLVPRSVEVLAPNGTVYTPHLIEAPRRDWFRIIALICALAVVGLGAFLLVRSRRDAIVSPVVRTVPIPDGDEVRILAGSTTSKLLDHFGNSWTGDRYFEGGSIATAPTRPIARTQDFAIYLTRREGTFSYNIPLKKGTYELRLYFAETVFGDNNMFGGGETSRVFHVTMNGTALLPYFDVIADAAGSNTADIRVFKDVVPAADGKLHLKFSGTEKAAFVNAIELMPSVKGQLRPIRLVSRDSSFTDKENRVWNSDRYYHGGVLIQRHLPILNTKDDVIYQSERYGNFSYSIPVAMNSRYTVTMRFCENWFGAPTMGEGGIGDRLFDVYSNGKVLLHHFDVFKEAGGPLRPLDRIFRGLEPNSQGKLVFEFVPVRNYAMVNAIEVLDESH